MDESFENESKTIDDLPPEILLKIFSNLSLTEVLCCQQVCKKWYSISNSIRFDEFESILSIFHSHRSDENRINLRILTDVKFMRLRKLKFKFNHFEDTFKPTLDEELSKLINNFKQTEELELTDYSGKISLFLHLPSLKCLNFVGSFKKLALHTPQLSRLVTERVTDNNLHVFYPEQLEYLQTFAVDNITDLEKMINLKILIVIDDHLFNAFSTRLFDRLPALKEVHYLGEDSYTRSLQVVQYLKNRPQLTLYYYCFKLHPDFQSIPSSYAESIEVSSFIASNYSKIETTILVDDTMNLDYDTLNLFFESIPNDFHQKIKRVFSLSIGSKVDEENLLLFIEKIKPMRLKFDHSDLSKSFFDRLSNFDSFTTISLEEPNLKTKENDFDFLLKMNNLIFLEINCQFDVAFLINIFERMDLEELVYEHTKFNISIYDCNLALDYLAYDPEQEDDNENEANESVFLYFQFHNKKEMIDFFHSLGKESTVLECMFLLDKLNEQENFSRKAFKRACLKPSIYI